ncbi:MAG: hypothetical protein HY881_13765 [Deltaproteobacteria bacterium]|nr:hypothetical protein [Deltaproteobacteria bacterium]
MSNRVAEAYRPLFPTKHIPIVLVSIVQAASTFSKKTDRDREDWITRRLHARLIRIREFRDGPFDIRLQPEIPSLDIDADTPAGRIDLLVSCGLGHEVYFAIEAKRLRVCSSDGRVSFHGSREYVMDGMMRFVSGQYAPHMEASAMLGYVFDGKIDKARSSIDKSVRKKATNLKLAHPGQLIRSPILAEMHIDETRHELSERFFTIYHVFIPV